MSGNLEMFGDPATNPMGWEVRKLGEAIATTQTGFAYGKWRDARGVPQLRPFNITSEGKLDLSTLKYVPENARLTERHLLQFDDIIFNNTNSPELVGKAAIFRSDQRCVFSNHLTRIRLSPGKATPDYVVLVLNLLWRDGFFQDRCQQWVNQAAINVDRLKGIEIPLPPLPLQQRFAELAVQLEGKRRQMERAAEDLERLYQSLLKKAFTGDLTRTWREDAYRRRQALVAAIVAEYRRLAREPMGITALVKHTFLAQEEEKVTPGPIPYHFIPWRYGPFTREIYDDLAELEEEGLLEVWRTGDVEGDEPNRVWVSTAQSGDAGVTERVALLGEEARASVCGLVERWAGKPLDDLLDYVYARYPDYTVRSERR